MLLCSFFNTATGKVNFIQLLHIATLTFAVSKDDFNVHASSELPVNKYPEEKLIRGTNGFFISAKGNKFH